MKVNKGLLFTLVILGMIRTAPVQAQDVTALELAKALKACRTVVASQNASIDSLTAALDITTDLYQKRVTCTDSLNVSLIQQLIIQDSVTTLMQTNADTLKAMLLDYDGKIDEVSRLYIKELEKQTRPWFLTKNGLKGLCYGLIVGGLLGFTLVVLD